MQTLAARSRLYINMYLVLIAWMYVAVMMAVAEATHSTGTLLGALVTFVLYGLLPMSIVLYLMGAPARRKAAKKREAADTALAMGVPTTVGPMDPTNFPARQTSPSDEPDAGGHAAGTAEPLAVAPVREEGR